MSNNKLAKKPRFSVAITTEEYQKLISNTLRDADKAKRFVASITSAVATNPALQDCEAGTILAGGLLGESLNLSPSPQLGQYYLVPFNDRKAGTKKAQFILGYKGYIQLAQRSGSVVKLDAVSIKQGEIVKIDPIKSEYEFEAISDYDERESAPTVGYYAYFELANGYRKEMYWSKKAMEIHADKYSSAFSLQSYQKLLKGEIPNNELWKYSSHWYAEFDAMAEKTMIRQVISKGGCPMSTEMLMAVANDETVVELADDFTVEDVLDEAEDEIVEQVDLSEL